MRKPLQIALCAISLGFSCATANGQGSAPPLKYADADISMRIVIRSREQLSAFYQGREFPGAAIDRILATCFFSPLIRNRGFDVLWLELDNWSFERDGKSIARFDREYWQGQWHDIDLDRRFRSTFGWTLLPEARDLRADENVGGSLALPWQEGPFTLVARFATGADRQGPEKVIRFEGVRCPAEN